MNSLFRLYRKTSPRLKTYGLQGRNSKHTHADGWRIFSVRSLPNEDSPHGRAYSCLYKFKKHSTFNVWENLNKKLFPFAYISRVMNGLLLLCIYGSLSVNFEIALRKNSAKTGIETLHVRRNRTRSKALEIPKSTVKRTAKTMRKSVES